MFLTGKEMRNILTKRVPGFNPDSYLDSINESYSQLADHRSWTFLERNFNLITKQYVSSGGAHFTNGATTITASTCADWTNGESNGFAGMFIKKSEEAAYYTITSSTSVEITINESYPGKTTTAAATAGDGYYVFKHLYSVDSTIETILYLMSYDFLEELDEAELERKDSHMWENGEPHKWRSAGTDSSGNTMVELYPRLVDDIYELRGKGKRKIETLTDTTKPLLDSYLILSYAEMDLMRRKRMISPDSITDDMINNAIAHFQDKLETAIRNDMRKETGGQYIHDRFFGTGHRGQKWLVEHDPFT